jgi:poly-gamma-glutamate synthesis protein (capsule biosynthesis protein)
MEQDVRAAKEVADVVAVTPHWGLHFVAGTVAEYETTVAHAAIDAGTDLVLGCHQHVLQPIQAYQGKAIFHGLGNFAMDVDISAHADSPAPREMQDLYPGTPCPTSRTTRPARSTRRRGAR